MDVLVGYTGGPQMNVGFTVSEAHNTLPYNHTAMMWCVPLPVCLVHSSMP